MIWILFILLMFAISLLSLNEYYYHVVLSNTQEQQILMGKKKTNLDWISFGSAYCRYGLQSGNNGFNFGVASQFFYYTDKLLKEYAESCLKPNGIVFLIIADLVFAEEGKGLYGADRYQLLLSQKSLSDEYSFYKYFKLRFPLLSSPRKIKQLLYYLIKGGKDSYSTTMENKLTKEQAIAAAKQRCKDWCDQFGLKDTVSTDITSDLEKVFVRTRSILTGMIDFCYEHGFTPVLVVTPVSGVMNAQLGEGFIKKVLYDNIRLANKQNAPFLDYLKDERFQDINLYNYNADFLNARGRRMFTKVLLQDAKTLMENKNYENRNSDVS